MAYLITPTLLNQFDWMMNIEPEKKNKAEEDFSNILHRIYPDPSPAILLGRKFEHYIMKSVKTGKDGSDKFNQIRDIFHKAKFQQNTKKTIKVDGEQYLLFGRMDALFPDKIIDLKTTSNYRGEDYYLKGWQHRIYSYCTNILNFAYVVVVLNEDEKIESYEIINHSIDIQLAKNLIIGKIRELNEFLEKNEHYEHAFKHIFTRY